MDDIQELKELAAAEGAEVEVPDDIDMDSAGPALLGRQPVVGSFRRENDMPVLRDKLAEAAEGI